MKYNNKVKCHMPIPDIYFLHTRNNKIRYTGTRKNMKPGK